MFLAAAKGGGIMAKKTYPADFVASNLAVQNNVIETAHAMMAMISALSNIQTTWQAIVITKNAVFFRTEITCLCLP